MRRPDVKKSMILKGIKGFKCDQCPFASHAKQYLADHKKIHHSNDENQYQTQNQGNLLRGIDNCSGVA